MQGEHQLTPGVYSLHYQQIVEEFAACPIPMLVGESETEAHYPLVASYYMYNIQYTKKFIVFLTFVAEE